jgi:hypothetical protein
MHDRRFASGALFLSFALAAGCGDDRAATEGACSDRPADLGTQGERTAHPSIAVTVFPAVFALRSINYVPVPANGDLPPIVRVFAELEYGGTETICASTADVSIGGYRQDAVLHGRPYLLPGFEDVTTDCLEPGDTAVIGTFLRDMTAEDLEAAVSGAIDIETNPDFGGTRATSATRSPGTVVETEAGFVVTQDITASEGLFNYFQDLFAIDERGLIIAELNVPADSAEAGGAAIGAGETVTLTSEPVPCAPVDWRIAESYIIRE